MKKYIFIVCFALISNTIWAQSASDYYLPVCKGNYLQFQTKTAYTGTDSGGWAFRKTHFSINNAAVFYGKTYFLEKGYEVLNNSPQDTSFFHRLWIREDANGKLEKEKSDFVLSFTNDKTQRIKLIHSEKSPYSNTRNAIYMPWFDHEKSLNEGAVFLTLKS
jgi:hypothetical protein